MEGAGPKQILFEKVKTLRKVYKEFSPSLATVYNWVPEFKLGRTSVEGDPPQGWPKSRSAPEIIAKIQHRFFSFKTSSCPKNRVFWDTKVTLLVHCLQTGKTINSIYYCKLLYELDEKKS